MCPPTPSWNSYSVNNSRSLGATRIAVLPAPHRARATSTNAILPTNHRIPCCPKPSHALPANASYHIACSTARVAPSSLAMSPQPKPINRVAEKHTGRIPTTDPEPLHQRSPQQPSESGGTRRSAVGPLPGEAGDRHVRPSTKSTRCNDNRSVINPPRASRLPCVLLRLAQNEQQGVRRLAAGLVHLLEAATSELLNVGLQNAYHALQSLAASYDNIRPHVSEVAVAPAPPCCLLVLNVCLVVVHATRQPSLVILPAETDW